MITFAGCYLIGNRNDYIVDVMVTTNDTDSRYIFS